MNHFSIKYNKRKKKIFILKKDFPQIKKDFGGIQQPKSDVFWFCLLQKLLIDQKNAQLLTMKKIKLVCSNVFFGIFEI